MRTAPSSAPESIGIAPRFRADIEGLRGVAILAVVGYHAGFGVLSGGYIGVDVFFVLSGFLITRLLVAELAATGRLDFWGFYARRFRRLLPALLTMVAGSLVIASLVGSVLDLDGWMHSARFVPVFLSNALFIHQATDYLAGSANHDLFLHTWSLAVEEQFYLVWPLLLALAAWFGRRRTAVLAATIGVVIAGSAAACVVLTGRAQPFAFFGSPTRFWEFGVGGLVALVPAAKVPTRVVATITSTLGLAAVVVACVTFDDRTAYPGSAVALPVIGTALVLAGGLGPAVGGASVLELRPMRWIGQRSYSWYLWHWPLLVILNVLRPAAGIKSSALVALVALVLADLSYRFVENPIRHAPALVRRPRRTALLGIGTVAISALLLVGLSGWTTRVSSSGSAGRFRAAEKDVASVYAKGCVAGFDATSAKVTPGCTLGDRHSSAVLAVLGDSHAAQWIPALEQIGRAKGLKVIPFVKNSCPASDVTPWSPTFGRSYRECAAYRASALRQIARLRPRYVVLGSFSNEATNPSTNGVSLATWKSGTERTIQLARSSGASVILLQDNPTARSSVPACLEHLDAVIHLASPSCTFPRETSSSEVILAAERAAARAAGARVVSTAPGVCPQPTCQPVVDGIVVYFDGSHITASYARHLEPWLLRQMDLDPSA